MKKMMFIAAIAMCAMACGNCKSSKCEGNCEQKCEQKCDSTCKKACADSAAVVEVADETEPVTE